MKDNRTINGKLETVIKDKNKIEELHNKYIIIRNFHEGLAAVGEKSLHPDFEFYERWGFINVLGELVIPLKYNQVSDFNDGFCNVKFGGEFSDEIEIIINNKGQTLLNFQGENQFLPFEFIKPFNDKLFKILSFEGWGLIDESAQIVLEAKYANISEPENGIAFLNNENEMSKSLRSLDPFDFGYYDNILYGCISDQGRLLIPQEYFEIKIINDKTAIVRKHNEYALFDLNNSKQVTSLAFEEIEPIGNDLFRVKKSKNNSNRNCIVNAKGNAQITDSNNNILFVPFEYIEKRHDGYYNVLKNNFWGILDSSFNLIVKPRYTQIDHLTHSYWVVHRPTSVKFRNGLTYEEKIIITKGLIRCDGELKVPCIYDYINPIGNNKAIFKDSLKNGEPSKGKPKEKSVGLIDILENKIIQEQIYDEIKEYKKNCSLFKLGSKYGYFDQNGDIAFNIYFDYASSFNSKGLSIVSYSGKYGIINYKGEVVMPFEYEHLIYLSEYETCIFEENNLCGLINLSGTKVINPTYEDLEIINKNLLKVRENGLYGCINIFGEIIIPVQYNYISFDEYCLDAVIFSNSTDLSNLCNLHIYFDFEGNEVKREYK